MFICFTQLTNADVLGGQPISDFCQRNMLLRFLKVNSDSSTYSEYSKKRTSELEEIASQLPHADNSWLLSLVPTEKTREAAAAKNRMRWVNDGRGLREEVVSDKNLEIFLSRLELRPQIDVDYEKSCWERTVRSQSRAFQVISRNQEFIEQGKFLTCGRLGLLSAGECKKGLDILQQRLATHEVNGGAIARTDIYRKILGSRVYEDGVRRAALKISKRVRGQIRSPGNLFDDLKDAFIETNVRRENVDDLVWDVLGLLATSGPNINQRIKSCQNSSAILEDRLDSQFHFSLKYIAGALPLLDFRYSRQFKKLYSAPSSVRVTCDNGKFYHFWMSAYLSRELVKRDGLSVQAAKNASYASEIGYQALRDVVGKESDDVSTSLFGKLGKHELFSPVVNIVRTDLALAAGGATFGALSTTTTNSNSVLSVDKSLQNILSKSGQGLSVDVNLNGKSKMIYEMYQWINALAPFEAMDSL